jgi:S-disulfanyl-L-cysteine oxidoreductase SoxD
VIPSLIFCLLLVSATAEAVEQTATPHLGVAPSAEVLARHRNLVYPDGEGLPPGSGSVAEGKTLFNTQCVACHGQNGRGGSGGELAGGNPDLTAPQPDKNIGTYWPYATTLFDFIRRSMPLTAPWSLSDDEVYAVVAYLLYLNGIIPETGVLNTENLAVIIMPNRDGFTPIDAEAFRH